jgi:hypothetical protein
MPRSPARFRRLTLETLCDRRVMENHAPVLDTSTHPTLSPSYANNTFNTAGTLVGDFANPRISDADADAQKGIAVIGLTERGSNQGDWQYSTDDGVTWLGIGDGSDEDLLFGSAPSDAAALVLKPNDRLRYDPAKNYFGIKPPQLTFRAWDQSDGATNGTIVDTTARQGSEGAYSEAFLSARQPIFSGVPIVALSGTVTSWRGDPPLPLAPNAKIALGSTNSFAGGYLRVVVVPQGQGNRLSIGAQFTDDGMMIGTKVGGYGEDPLTVLLHANATRSVVQQLVRSISYQNVYGSLQTRKVEFRLTDSSNATSPVAEKVVLVTTTPVLKISGTVEYQRNDPPVFVAPYAEVNYANRSVSTFAGWTLTVAVSPSGENNTLGIGSALTVSSDIVNDGNPVLYNGNIIGYRVSNGVGTNTLKITFNSNCTRASLEDLIRAINYQNVGGETGERTITFTLNYNDHASIGSKQVNVT